MAFRICVVAFVLLLSISCTESSLSLDYYKQACPNLEKMIEDLAKVEHKGNPRITAAVLRLFLHDCLVEGCDGSVLISSAGAGQAERDADINLALPEDGFAVVDRAKAALEKYCPGVVSCADILALMTRDLLVIAGGKRYNVLLGRKDGLHSQASRAMENLPRPNMTVTESIEFFEAKGFNAKELMALMGSHRLAFVNCSEIIARLPHYNQNTKWDPSVNKKYDKVLREACHGSRWIFNIDYYKFDNGFYKTMLNTLGLLATDIEFPKDSRLKPYIDFYDANSSTFHDDFAAAMEKLGVLGVKTGNEGEIRHQCDAFIDAEYN